MDRDGFGRPRARSQRTTGLVDIGSPLPGTSRSLVGPQGGRPGTTVALPHARPGTGGPGTSRPGGEPPHRGRAPAGRSRWVAAITGSRLARQAALLACYLAAGVATTWPRATYLAGSLPASRDAGGYVWGFWWMARQVIHLSNPWWTSDLAAPVGTQLAFHTLMPLPGLVMTPVTLVFGPSASYNLLSIVCPGLLCYVMYRAARLWLPTGPGAIAAGAFFGLSSSLAWRSWNEVNLALGAMFLPMVLEAGVRLRRTRGRRQAVILGLVLGTAMLTDQESAVLAVILAGLVLVPWLLRQPGRATLRPAAQAGAVAAAVASPQVAAMIWQTVTGGAHIPLHALTHSYLGSGAGLVQMFAPSPRLAAYHMPGLASVYYHGRPGYVVVGYGLVLSLAAVAGLVAAWRRPAARMLGLLWLGCSALALGPVPWIQNRSYHPLAIVEHGARLSALMPYTWLVRIPGLANFREADRFTELGLLAAALLAGAAVSWLAPRARPVLVVVLALGALEAGWSGNLPSEPWPIGTMPTALPALDAPIAADHSRSIVVDVPFGIRGGVPLSGIPFPPETMVLATADGHPLADGYDSRTPPATLSGIGHRAFYAGLLKAQRGLSAGTPAGQRRARRNARQMHIGWVLVWVSDPAIRGYLLETGFRLAYRADGVSVYRPASGLAGPGGPASPAAVPASSSSSRPSAARLRTRPRSPAARPALSSADSAARMRAWRDCQACQTRPAIMRPSGVR